MAKVSENTTLITIGHRTRVRSQKEDIKHVSFKDGWLPKDQEHIEKEWTALIGKVPESEYVLGAGENGIYTLPLAEQCAQIALPKNTWCISNGLGLVNFTEKYPQYYLGTQEVDIRKFTKTGTDVVDHKRWWSYLCEQNGNSLFSLITGAIKSKHRIIVAASGVAFLRVMDDLKSLTDKDKLAAVKLKKLDVYDHLRFVGPDIDLALPSQLMPCIMPHDRDAMSILVPGSRSNGSRRAAFLLQHVSPVPKDGKTSGKDDAEAMQNAFTDTDSVEPLNYVARVHQVYVSAKEAVTDEQLEEMLENNYLTIMAPVPMRLMRLMRSDGIRVTQERIERALDAMEIEYIKSDEPEDVVEELEAEAEDTSEDDNEATKAPAKTMRKSKKTAKQHVEEDEEVDA